MAAPSPSKPDSEDERIEAELDRAQRLASALNDPEDQAIIQRYISELEARIRAWPRFPLRGADFH